MPRNNRGLENRNADRAVDVSNILRNFVSELSWKLFLIRPTKMEIVHTMQDRDDLTKIVQREKVVAQRPEHSFPLFTERLRRH